MCNMTFNFHRQAIRFIASLCCAMAATITLSVALPVTAHAQGGLLGEVYLSALNFCPRDSMKADGRILSIGRNPHLHKLFGVRFGGDNRTTIALPDMRPNHYEARDSDNLHWCVRTQGAYPRLDGAKQVADTGTLGQIRAFAFETCPAGWRRFYHGAVQAQPRNVPNQQEGQLVRCMEEAAWPSTGYDSDQMGTMIEVVGQNCSTNAVTSYGYEIPILGEYDFIAGENFTKSQRLAVFSLIGTRYGGDGRNTFNLPSRSAQPDMDWCFVKSGTFPSRS